MTWYSILFFVTLVYFVIKFILSLVFGDLDIDFDSDGEVDTDVSSMLSLKGILHFLLGFSCTLFFIDKFNMGDVYDYVGDYPFTVMNFISAIIIGLIFMVGLFYVYKLVLKLDHSNVNEMDINGFKCSILINLGNGSYEVLVYTPSGTLKKQVYAVDNKDDLLVGSNHIITKCDNKYYI